MCAAGFPGEGDEAHRELVDFVRDFKFERMGAFAYSEEDGTPAADLPEQLPQRIRLAATGDGGGGEGVSCGGCGGARAARRREAVAMGLWWPTR